MQEAVRFAAKPDQQAIMREGHPALISRKEHSVVMIRPASRRFESGTRPVFVVGVRNLSEEPFDFSLRDIAVAQLAGAEAVPLKVFSYDELVAEEETKQVVAALLVGAVAGANLAAASQAGYRTRTTTEHSPSGTRTFRSVSYNPSRALAAQKRALRQNQRLIGAAIKQGGAKLDALERETIQEHTLLPGEWYGGTLHVQPPEAATDVNGPKRYAIAMTVGSDRHEIEVIQEKLE
jgi:hypothetical protein